MRMVRPYSAGGTYQWTFCVRPAAAMKRLAGVDCDEKSTLQRLLKHSAAEEELHNPKNHQERVDFLDNGIYA